MSQTVTTRPLANTDLGAVSALHDRVFGPGRFTRTAYRIRETRAGGALQVSRLCRGAFLGPRMIASITMTEITIGGTGGAALLGPLAVDPDFAGQGYGRQLVGEALETASELGCKIVVLVGDEPYYSRFGFKCVPPGRIAFPGPVDPARILAAELEPGAGAAYQGMIAAG